MKRFCNFDVFSYGKNYSDLTTCGQFNRCENISEDGFDFNIYEFQKILTYNKLQVKKEVLFELKKKLLIDGCVSVFTQENGNNKQWVVILKMTEE